MQPRTRRSVLAAVGATLPFAGCVTDSDGRSGTDDPTTDTAKTRRTSTPSDTPTETRTTDSTTTGDWIDRASRKPDPDHSVSLVNEGDENRTVRVRVVREASGEPVFDETREAFPGSESELYNLKRADPDGVEAFTVCGELVESTATGGTAATTANGSDASESEFRSCATIRTNECYGNAYVTIREDGALQVVYAIC